MKEQVLELLHFVEKKYLRKSQNEREKLSWKILHSKIKKAVELELFDGATAAAVEYDSFCFFALNAAKLINNKNLFFGGSLRVARIIKRKKQVKKKLPTSIHNAILLGDQNPHSKAYIKLIQS